MTIALIAIVALGAWLYLFTARGNFWQMSAPAAPPHAASSKSVCVVIPARNEEAVIGQAVASLAGRAAHIIVVDDHSSDRTAEIARQHGATVIPAGPLPAGWSGKLWAISGGLQHARALAPDYLLLTDADIVHSPTNIAGLVTRAETERLDIASLMVKLRCRSLAETLLIPAFVFFFFMLYPPAWVANPRRRTAAAAGGCILIRPSALDRIGGIQSIRGEIIDDCALSRAVKRTGGRISIALTRDTVSVRDYTTFAEIRAIIARTAFAQLRHSTLLLAGTILGMALIYLAPPLLLFCGKPLLVMAGLASWFLMMIAYAPALKFYGRSLAWAPLLPAIALFYMSATVDSAIAYWSGRGGVWKDRIQDFT
ncbi:MAG TPA: glycosyltransferase [Bryobacteraceae bacterium]|nr:glycosyltransferase [Bryobacteraceae bacterium]